MIALSTLLCLAAVLAVSALGGYALQRVGFYEHPNAEIGQSDERKEHNGKN